MAKCWVKKELPSQGYSNISVRVWETALMCCWLIHFRNGHPSDSSRESKSWFPPQHSLFKHNPWSDVLCWQGIYLFTMLLMEIFKFFKPACVKYKCRCVLGVPGGWIPISTSWVWSHWVFLHCCAFILTGGIAAKIWDRSGSVAVAGEFWKLFSCAVSSLRKKTWEKFLCSVLCEEKKTWEKFFSCAMFSVRKTGHPWLVWPAEREDGTGNPGRFVELMSLKDLRIQQPCSELSGDPAVRRGQHEGPWPCVVLCCWGKKGINERGDLEGNVSMDVQNQLESIKLTGIKHGTLKDHPS